MPDPDLAETSKICIRGRTLSMFQRAAARSESAASAKSILVMIATSELLKMVGYFNGLSSPSVAESRTKRSSSPRSIAGRADEIAALVVGNYHFAGNGQTHVNLLGARAG